MAADDRDSMQPPLGIVSLGPIATVKMTAARLVDNIVCSKKKKGLRIKPSDQQPLIEEDDRKPHKYRI